MQTAIKTSGLSNPCQKIKIEVKNEFEYLEKN